VGAFVTATDEDSRQGGEDCHTAVLGEACYDGVIWAMKSGIKSHPRWFEGLIEDSRFEDFQAVLHRSKTEGCPMPCAEGGGEFVLITHQTTSTPKPIRVWSSVIGGSSNEPCNPLAEIPMNLEPQFWDISEEMSDYCRKMVSITQPKLTAPGSFGRNWCWVGMKESCHKNLWYHYTWEEERQKALKKTETVPSSFHPLQNHELCDRREPGQAIQFELSDWTEAMSWFRNNVAVYVLSLPQSKQRIDTISKRLNQLDIPFSFVWGVDMRQPTALQEARKEGLIPLSYSIEKAQAEADQAKNDMGRFGSIAGTIGCAAGHFRAQRRARDSGKSLAVVFEDDVSPTDDFVPRLWSLVKSELPCDWQAVSLASRCPFGRCVTPHLTRVLPDVNEPDWRCRHGVNYGFQGMLYRTDQIQALQETWMPTVFDEERPHCLDVDVALASISDRVKFYAVPSVQTPGFLSELRMGSSRVDINWQQKQQPQAPPPQGAPQAPPPQVAAQAHPNGPPPPADG